MFNSHVNAFPGHLLPLFNPFFIQSKLWLFVITQHQQKHKDFPYCSLPLPLPTRPTTFTPCQNFLPQTVAHLHKHAKERFPVVCPQARKLSGTWEVTAAGINSDLRTMTKRNTEILQKPKPQLQEKRWYLKSFAKCSSRWGNFAQTSEQIRFLMLV